MPGIAEAMEIAVQQRQYETAIEICKQAVQAEPELVHAYHTMGFCLQMQGRHSEAIQSYKQAIKLEPDFAEAYNHMAVALSNEGQHAQAIENYKYAIELKPDYADAYNNLGIALSTQKQFDQAIDSYEQAITLEPESPDVYYNLAGLLKDQKRYAQAVENYKQVLRLAPNYPAAYNNMAIALKELGRLDEATECFNKAIQLNPDYAQAYNNLGLLLKSQGLYTESIENYEKAIQLSPDYANAHWNLSLDLLSIGKFTQGWEQYQWRRKADLDTILYPQKREMSNWDGSSFVGKKLLIRYEQGMGDNLQFVRYAPMVKARGGTVIFETLKPMYNLLQGCDGIDELVEASTDGTPTTEFDLHVFLLDLPRVLGTTLETIPANVPYLYPGNEKINYWSQQLKGEEFKVGIVWAGSPKHSNDHNRSCPLKCFEPLTQIKGVRLYGLQKGAAAVQTAVLANTMPIENLAEQFEDFTDTAAVIQNLDLVISVDTAALHLAGAIAKPVWAVLPFVPDWRWMLHTKNSPWYPTMRLFRQEQPGQWDDVFAQITEELKILIKK